MNPTPHDIAEYRICADSMPYVDRASFTALLDAYEKSDELVSKLSNEGIDTMEELKRHFDEADKNETKVEELSGEVDEMKHAFSCEADNLEDVLNFLEDSNSEIREIGLKDLRSIQGRLREVKT